MSVTESAVAPLLRTRPSDEQAEEDPRHRRLVRRSMTETHAIEPPRGAFVSRDKAAENREARSCFLHGDYTGRDSCPACVSRTAKAADEVYCDLCGKAVPEIRCQACVVFSNSAEIAMLNEQLVNLSAVCDQLHQASSKLWGGLGALGELIDWLRDADEPLEMRTNCFLIADRIQAAMKAMGCKHYPPFDHENFSGDEDRS